MITVSLAISKTLGRKLEVISYLVAVQPTSNKNVVVAHRSPIVVWVPIADVCTRTDIVTFCWRKILSHRIRKLIVLKGCCKLHSLVEAENALTLSRPIIVEAELMRIHSRETLCQVVKNLNSSGFYRCIHLRGL